MADFPPQIRGYSLKRHIASGGMADVFEAMHPTTGRRVALKLMKDELRHKPTGPARFSREVQAMAVLSHANIVSIVDAGVAEAGHPFLVMDYIDGPCLRHVIKQQGVLTPQRAVAIALQIARALSYAHQASVIHRDLKPENILLENSPDKTDHVVLIDFGVSRVLGDEATDGGLTSNGSVLGTPHYMSPEQARGDVNLKPSTDCYALGVIMYEMLSGERAHQGATRQAILHHVMYHRVKPLASGSTNPFPELIALVARCLDKRQEARPHATEIVQLLEGSLKRGSVAAYQSSMDTLTNAPTPTRFKQRTVKYAAGALLAASCGWGLRAAVVDPVRVDVARLGTATEGAVLPPTPPLPNEFSAGTDRSDALDDRQETRNALSSTSLKLEGNAWRNAEDKDERAGAPLREGPQVPAAHRHERVDSIVMRRNVPRTLTSRAPMESTPHRKPVALPTAPSVLARPLLQNPYATQVQ